VLIDKNTAKGAGLERTFSAALKELAFTGQYVYPLVDSSMQQRSLGEET
jgi:hypothetical protein